MALHYAIRWAGGREREFLRDIMAPEVEAGTLTTEELEALTARKPKRHSKHVQRAARDLAEDLARGDEAAIQHSRAEIARLR